VQLVWEHFLIKTAIQELGGKAKTNQIQNKMKEYGHTLSEQYIEHYLFEMRANGLVDKTPQGEWVLND